MARGISTLATYDPTGGMWGVDAWANFGRALAAIAANRRAAQDKQQQRDLQQVNYLVGLAQKDPELANNTAFYHQVTDRYGQSFPEVGPIMDTLRNRGQILDTAKATHVRYLQAQGQMQQAHDALSSQLDATPDTLPNGAPNVDKHVLLGQMLQLGDPATFPQKALSQFTPEERSQISLTTKMFGDSMPTALDPYKQFTPEGKERYAVQTGAIDPNSLVGKAAQIKAGLMVSPVRQIEMDRADELERAKRKAAMEEIDARYAAAHKGRVESDTMARGRLKLENTYRLGQIDYGVDAAERKYDYSHPAADPGQVSYKDIVAGVKGAQAAWDAQSRASLAKVPQGASAAKIKADFVAQYGPRPQDITPGDAMVLALRAQQAGAGDPTAAQTAVSHMVSNYQAARAAGKSASDALATAQPGVPPIAAQPLPVPGMSAPQKPAGDGAPWYSGILGALGGAANAVGHMTGQLGAQPTPAPPPAGTPGPAAPPPSAAAPAPQAAPAMDAALSRFVGPAAQDLAVHGEAAVRQKLQADHGITGPALEQVMAAAQAAVSQRRLVAQKAAIDAATGTDSGADAGDQGDDDQQP